jgi:hypothetical protein
MTTLSVRDIADRHLGKIGDLSVDADVYGYIHRDASSRLFGSLQPSDVLPGSGTLESPTTRSLRRHLETVSGTSVDLVMFLVGHEPAFSGVVTVEQVAKLQYAVQVARDVYARADIGIRRVEWGRVPVALAGGFADITTVFGATSLTMQFTGRDGAIDVFAVQTMKMLQGRSPKPGPCNKHVLLDVPSVLAMTGCVIGLGGTTGGDGSPPSTPQFTGIAVAHEVGHYLGLGHEPDEGNVMCSGKRGCEASEGMLELTGDQGLRMKAHCMINPGD